MARYIDAEEAMGNLKLQMEIAKHEGRNDSVTDKIIIKMIQYFASCPTRNVKPIVYAHWEYDKNANDWGIGG